MSKIKVPEIVIHIPATEIDAMDTISSINSYVRVGLNEQLDIALKQISALKMDLALKSASRRLQQEKTPEKKVPKITEPIIKIKDSLAKRLAKKSSTPEKFGVFVRKGGEDISIGTVGTKGEAKRLLKSKLSKTLRASGFVEKGGVKLKVGELGGLGFGFEKSKKDSFRVVEKKTRRIKKGSGEVSEILAFRKKPRKSKKKRGFFGF